MKTEEYMSDNLDKQKPMFTEEQVIPLVRCILFALENLKTCGRATGVLEDKEVVSWDMMCIRALDGVGVKVDPNELRKIWEPKRKKRACHD